MPNTVFKYNPTRPQLQADLQNRAVLWQQPAQYAQNYVGGYGAYQQGLGSLGQSMAGAYGSQAGALAGLANAAASERSARQGAVGSAESARQNAVQGIANAYAADRGARSTANSAAEAARQQAMGNIGSSALGAYGSAAGSALGAWATNQTAYNKAVADMMAANQAAMSQFGTSRNQALGNIAGSYGAAAQGLGAAAATPNTSFSMGAGGMFGGGGVPDADFEAYGPDGMIASATGPSYSSGGGSGGDMSLAGGKYVNPEMFASVAGPTYAGLAASLGALDSGGYADRMAASNAASRGQLDRQHYSSRGQPGQMLGQALGGLLTLGNQSIGAANSGMDQYYGSNSPANYGQFLGSSAGGMNQFYANDNPMNMSGLASSINGGYGDALRGLTSMQGGMTQGFNQTNANLNDLWKKSLGRVDWGFNPWEQATTGFTGWAITPEQAQYEANNPVRVGASGPVGAFGRG